MPLQPSLPDLPALYRPRSAEESTLYRILQDHLETFLLHDRRRSDTPLAPFAEDHLRAFLECGVPRFGLARFLCRSCGNDVFVPFSCKTRLSCPSCDSRRSVLTAAHALGDLLPHVPYRQWVLVLPKRLRYFVHRDAALAGEIGRILTSTLTARCLDKALPDPVPGSAKPRGPAAPAQLIFVQRFGGKVNLHVHFHAVVSDGAFTLQDERLVFLPAAPPSGEEITRLVEALRRRILKRLVRINAIPKETAEELLRREHGGFSLHAEAAVEASDREGLKRLLAYCTRPAVSIKRLDYRPESNLVAYRPKGPRAPEGEPAVLQWTPTGFIARFAQIIPPPYLNLVRYAGALGPRSALRPSVTRAARSAVALDRLLAGWEPPVLQIPPQVDALAQKIASAAARAWAVCIRRVFGAYPMLCPGCGTGMELAAIITDDRNLVRILSRLGLSTDFPILKSARDPPSPFNTDSQVDPATLAADDKGDQTQEI